MEITKELEALAKYQNSGAPIILLIAKLYLAIMPHYLAIS